MFARLQHWLHSPSLLTQLLVLTGLWHLLLASVAPLSVDEAHYALYASHPALSYFDHPPLVGWLQMPFLWVSSHELSLRLLAIMSYGLTLWLLHRFTLAQTGQLVTANLSILLFAAMPMTFLLGLAVVPETLLLPLTLGLLWQGLRTLNQPTWQNWVILGLLIGLAGLSKYTSLLMAIGLLVMLWFSQMRHLMLSWGFWLAISISLLMISPILLWNAQHDWMSILYQLNHGAPDDPWQWQQLLQSQLAQAFSYSPLVWLGAWLLTLGLWRYRQHQQFALLKMTWLFALPGLLVFTLASGKEPSLPHWLLFFYLLWLPWLSQWLIAQSARLAQWILLLSLAYTGLILLLVSLFILFPRAGQLFTPNPAQDLFGWKPAASLAQQHRLATEPLLVSSWVHASRLAWYARPSPVVVLDTRVDQFDLWFGSAQTGQSGLLVLPPDADAKQRAILSTFTDCTQLATTEEDFLLYRCHGWQSN